MRNVAMIPQAGAKYSDSGQIISLFENFVHGMLICGGKAVMVTQILEIDAKISLYTIIKGKRLLRFFGLNIKQQEDYFTSIIGEEKLLYIENDPIIRIIHRKQEEKPNTVKM